eukprot:403358755
MSKINIKQKSNVGNKMQMITGIGNGEVNLNLPANNQFFQRRQEQQSNNQIQQNQARDVVIQNEDGRSSQPKQGRNPLGHLLQVTSPVSHPVDERLSDVPQTINQYLPSQQNQQQNYNNLLSPSTTNMTQSHNQNKNIQRIGSKSVTPLNNQTSAQKFEKSQSPLIPGEGQSSRDYQGHLNFQNKLIAGGGFLTPNALKQTGQLKRQEYLQSLTPSMYPVTQQQLNLPFQALQNQISPVSHQKLNSMMIMNSQYSNQAIDIQLFQRKEKRSQIVTKSIDALNQQKNIYLKQYKKKYSIQSPHESNFSLQTQNRANSTRQFNNTSGQQQLQSLNKQNLHQNTKSMLSSHTEQFPPRVIQDPNGNQQSKYSLDINNQSNGIISKQVKTPQPQSQNKESRSKFYTQPQYRPKLFQQNKKNIEQFNLDLVENLKNERYDIQKFQNKIQNVNLSSKLGSNSKFRNKSQTQEEYKILTQSRNQTLGIQHSQQRLKEDDSSIMDNPLAKQSTLTRSFQPRQKQANENIHDITLSKSSSVPNIDSNNPPSIMIHNSRKSSQNSLGEKSQSKVKFSDQSLPVQVKFQSPNGILVTKKDSTKSLTQAKMNYLRRGTLTGGFNGSAFRTMKTNRESISKRLELLETVREIQAKFVRNHSVEESEQLSDSLGSIVSHSDSESEDSKKNLNIAKKRNSLVQKNRKQSTVTNQRRISTVAPLLNQVSSVDIFENSIFESVFKNDIALLRDIIGNYTTVFERCKRINTVDKLKRTPIFYAVFHDNYEITSYLLNQGADTLFIDSEGRTILHYASIFSSNRNLTQLILDYNNQMDIEINHSPDGLRVYKEKEKNQFDIPKRVLSLQRPQLNIEVDMFGGKEKFIESQPVKPKFEKLHIGDVQQPMTSLMPKKNRILDASKLSVIKDDESNASASQNNASENNRQSPNTQSNQNKFSFGLGNPAENKMLLQRQKSKRVGLPRSGSTIAPNSVNGGSNMNPSGKMSSMSSQIAEERGKFNLELQIKKSDKYIKQIDKYINVADKQGKTALFFACQKAKLPLVKLLCERGAIPITRDHLRRKPIDVSQTQDIYSLISQQENIFEEKFSNNLKSFRRSIVLDDFEKLRLQQIQQTSKTFRKSVQEEIKELKTEDDLESIQNTKHFSPQIKKSKDLGKRLTKKSELSKIELSSWSDNLLNKFQLGIYKDNVMTYKMRFNDKQVFEYILKRGLSTLSANQQGNNIVHYSIQLEKYEFLSFLVEGTFESELYERSLRLQEDSLFDLFLNQQAKELHEIIESNQCPWILESLYALEKCNEKEGNNSLNMAIDIGNFQLFCYIITIFKIRDHLLHIDEDKYSKYFKPFTTLLEFKNNQESTPLLYCAKRNQFKMFQVLLMQGAQINTVCSKLMNVLHYAVLNENQNMIEQIVYCDAETDRLQNEKNYRNQTPVNLDDKKKYTLVFNHIWSVVSLCTPSNMEQLDFLIQSEKFQVNQKTLIGQNTPLHIAVINENLKAIEYLCKYQEINLYERNSLGQTPRDIALLIPKRRVANKIIDFFNKKIQMQNARDKSNLSPAFQKSAGGLLLRKSTFGKKGALSRQGTRNFAIVPKQTENKRSGSQINCFTSINFDLQIRNFIDQMGKVVIGIERSNSVMGKKQSTTSIDSSENSNDYLDEESSFGSNMFLASQASFVIDNDFKTLQNNNLNSKTNQKQNWEPLKIQKLLRIYDNFLENSDLLGNFSPHIFLKWKQQLQRLDEQSQLKIKDLFKQYDDKKKGVVRTENIIKNRQPIVISNIFNEAQLVRFMEFMNKNYINAKLTETVFVKIVNQHIQEKNIGNNNAVSSSNQMNINNQSSSNSNTCNNL